jgi:hypothetical protein
MAKFVELSESDLNTVAGGRDVTEAAPVHREPAIPAIPLIPAIPAGSIPRVPAV